MELDGTGPDRRLGFDDGSTQKFRHALQTDFTDIREFFLGSNGSPVPGFTGRLISAVNANLRTFPESARIGVFVDTQA